MALASTNQGSQQVYGAQGNPIQNNFQQPVIATRDPTSSDINYKLGRQWINKSTPSMWFLGAKASSTATWIAAGSGTSGGVVTITASSGGALSPLAGNISILGTANQVTTAGSGHTVTLTLPATLIAPGSIASTSTIVAGSTVTGTTGLVATSGNITATNGNFVLTAAGNKINRGSVASTTAAGANSIGSVTLVGGTATIATTSVGASSLVRLTRLGVGATGAAALGILSVGTITAGVSFVINAVQAADATALQASDVSSIMWEIIN